MNFSFILLCIIVLVFANEDKKSFIEKILKNTDKECKVKLYNSITNKKNIIDPDCLKQIEPELEKHNYSWNDFRKYVKVYIKESKDEAMMKELLHRTLIIVGLFLVAIVGFFMYICNSMNHRYMKCEYAKMDKIEAEKEKNKKEK